MAWIWNDIARIKQECRYFDSIAVYPVVSPIRGIVRMPLYNLASWAREGELQPLLCFRSSPCCSVAEQGSPSRANTDRSPYTTPDALLQLAFVRIWPVVRGKAWARWKEIEGGKKIAENEERRRTFPSPGQKCLCSYSVLTLQNSLSCVLLPAPILTFVQVFISFPPFLSFLLPEFQGKIKICWILQWYSLGQLWQ